MRLLIVVGHNNNLKSDIVMHCSMVLFHCVKDWSMAQLPPGCLYIMVSE